MKPFLFIFRLLFSVYALTLFLAFLLLIFPVVVAASFFGRIKGGNITYWLCQRWTDFILFFSFIRTQYICDGTKPQQGKQYVFVFNHISYLDIPFLMKAFRTHQFRVLGKAELAKIPVFGFLYRTAAVLVDRSSAAARAKSVEQLKSVLRKNISIVIAPEGTFNKTHKPLKEFYDGAFKIAIETQTPIKPVLFLDAYNRLHYDALLSLTPGRCRIVYLNEVPVTGYALEDTQALKEKVYNMMEQKLIAYKAAWINDNKA
jgi:1-acyl-sn-glycerol-3-phosphate acyltransferase